MSQRIVPLVGLGLVLVFAAMSVPAQTVTSIISFAGNNGVNPSAGLILGSDGDFYGTTFQGGANDNFQGTVFKITPLGALTTLHSFQGSPSDGAFPYAGLVQGTDGSFYGTTQAGGSNSNCSTGCGTVFKVNADGSGYKVLHNFDGTDGATPVGALIQASDMNLYGTTLYGGTGNNCTTLQPPGCGTAFKIMPDGSGFMVLHNFNFIDGYEPYAGLLIGPDGNFYGTTAEGVARGQVCGFGCGTVFEMNATTFKVTTLHVFQGPDGQFPQAPLLVGADGNFYGTTSNGGSNSGCFFTHCGTVFKINSQGTSFSSFSSSAATGSASTAPLTLGPDGRLYGTAGLDGAHNGGSVFRFDPVTLVITALYSFCAQQSCIDGSSPEAGLVRYTDGTYWGTAFGGGAFGEGIVFSLGPAVSLSPSSLDFGAQGIDRMNVPQISTLTNTSGVDLAISNITISGANSSDYSQTNNCPSTLSSEGSCQITVVFSPTGVGTRTANVTITDNAVDSPQMISLTGIGVGGKVALR